jgi:hypothetical protein
MALPHPQTRKNKYGKEEKPNSGCVVGDVFKWTVNITKYWNAEHNMNPAKNRTFGGITHQHKPFLLKIRGKHFPTRDSRVLDCLAAEKDTLK